MNAIMNMKGRQTKLLAAIAILAMVVCVFAMAIPSESDGAVSTDPNAEVVNSASEISEIEDGTSEDVKVYKLGQDIDLDEPLTIGQYTVLYTDGHKLNAGSNLLTVNGVLYVNGNADGSATGNLTINDTGDSSILANGSIVFDKNGSLYVTLFNSTTIGADGGVTLTSGTLEIVEKTDTDGFTVTLTEGSVATVNKYSVWGTDSVVIDANATMTVTGTLTNDGTITNNGNITIAQGATFTNDNVYSGNNVFNNGGNIGGDGNSVPTYDSNTKYAEASSTAQIDAYAAQNIKVIVLTDGLTDGLTISNDYSLPEGITLYLNGNTITVDENGTLNITNSTVRTGAPAGYSGTANEGGLISVATDGTLILDGADVYAPVDADTEDGATVVLRNTKSYTISNGTITSPIEVGYGNTVNAESITVQSGLRIDVYGNFNVAGSLRITDGTFTVYQGGTATVSGNLNIASDAVIDGVLNVNSNVTVQGSGSPASFTVGATGEVNVASGATFTVARGNSVVTNTLTVVSGGEFNVEGTLAMNGTLSGAVNAYGTVQMNGVLGGDSTVNLYDGTSITVTSISGNGTHKLTITDKYAATDAIGDLTGQKSSQGNEVVLTPADGETIGGITVSVEVTQFVYEGVGSYIADMTIGGTIVSSANGGEVDVTGATGEVYYNADGEKRTGYVYVQDMTLNANTSLEFVNGSVFVEGTLNATAKDTASGAKAHISIDAGSVTVNGTITSIDALEDYINAGHYETLVNADTINNYVNADAAIAAIGEAQMNEVDFYGTTKVTVDATIPANSNVTINSGATLVVDATLTIADNAYVINNGAIQVDDTLVITNYLATINSVAQIKADVMTESGDDRTYMSLAAAMASGATEIVLNQTVTVEKDLTIPEGVTVTSDQWGFKVNDDVTLTVDGAIELTGRTAENKIVLADNTATSDDEAELVVNGHVSYAAVTTDPLAKIEGAHFQKKVDGMNTQFISNLAYAAENCSEGTVTIYGNVTAGDVTFTAAENKTLTIKVLNISAEEKSTLTVGTLTLVGATLDLTDNTPTGTYTVAGTVTGTVAVSAADAVVGSIDADRATGFKLAAGSEVTAEGTTNYAYLTGAIEGDVTVSAGTVTVGPADTDNLVINDDSTLTVASGATLAVAQDLTVSNADDADENEDAVLTVDGTITVGEGAKLTIKGDAVVNGTMDVLSTEDGQGHIRNCLHRNPRRHRSRHRRNLQRQGRPLHREGSHVRRHQAHHARRRRIRRRNIPHRHRIRQGLRRSRRRRSRVRHQQHHGRRVHPVPHQRIGVHDRLRRRIRRDLRRHRRRGLRDLRNQERGQLRRGSRRDIQGHRTLRHRQLVHLRVHGRQHRPQGHRQGRKGLRRLREGRGRRRRRYSLRGRRTHPLHRQRADIRQLRQL